MADLGPDPRSEMTDLSPHSALNPDKLPRPFSVGLSALDPMDWIMPDVHLADQLRDKAEHFARTA